MASMGPVLPVPHDRDSAAEDRRDRQHERIMLREHPRLEVEMLAAFGGDNANNALSAFGGLRQRHLIEHWPATIPPFRPAIAGRVLLLGAACSALTEAFGPTDLIDPSFTQADPYQLPLLGLALPYDDAELDWAVVPDLRGLMPESLICRIFQEASRVAKRALVALSRVAEKRTPIITESAARQIDRPYWERSFRISRSYYDWDLIPLGSRPSVDLFNLAPHVSTSSACEREAAAD